MTPAPENRPETVAEPASTSGAAARDDEKRGVCHVVRQWLAERWTDVSGGRCGYEEMGGTNGDLSFCENTQSDFTRRAAAIYLRQGVCNEKFDRHPMGASGTAAYVALHSTPHYWLEMIVSVALLALALLEPPASIHVVGGVPMLWMHLAMELCCLMVIAGQVALKVRWLGPKKYLGHTLSAIKTAVLLVMLVEACVVTIRQMSHIRLTRCLRPVFLLDSHYCYNIRRFTRQLIHALPPVLDMLLLLFTFIWLFSIIGYFFFNEVSPEHFGDPYQSFISLFVLLTTANNPDMMMQAFDANRLNCIFFIAYLCIMLYFLMNILLAVVYEDFSSHERTKYGKLLAHRLEGARKAYKLLKSPEGIISTADGQQLNLPEGVSFSDFCTMMQNYKQTATNSPTTILHNYLAFCAILFSKNENGVLTSGPEDFRLTLEQFSNVYNVSDLRWRPTGGGVNIAASGEQNGAGLLRKLADGVHNFCATLVDSRVTKAVIYALCFACGFGYTAVASLYEYGSSLPHLSEWTQMYDAFTSTFIIVFVVEVTVHLAVYPSLFFLSPWNVFDLLITYTSAIALICYVCGVSGARSVANLILLRFLDVFQLLGARSRFRHIAESMSLITPRLASAAIVLLLIYYMFAIFAMEFFAGAPLRDCCKNTSIEQYYTDSGLFYLNNFNNLLISYVTLWNLMCVNNWHVIMTAYRLTVGEWSIVFFLTFYIITAIVLTVIVAFIMEAFLFRIQCSRRQPHLGTSSSPYHSLRLAITTNEYNLIMDSASGFSVSGIFGASGSSSGSVDETDLILERLKATVDMICSRVEESRIYSITVHTAIHERADTLKQHGDTVATNLQQRVDTKYSVLTTTPQCVRMWARGETHIRSNVVTT